MRGKNPKCPFRPQRADGADEDAPEVQADDVPSDGEGVLDDMLLEEEDAGDEEDTAADTGDNTTKLLQNIFPFAFPVALHTRTLAALKAGDIRVPCRGVRPCTRQQRTPATSRGVWASEAWAAEAVLVI